MSVTVNNPTKVTICNSSPHFRNIADMRIKCENADLIRWRICGCGPSELDFCTFATLSWIHIRICRDQQSLAYAEVDSDQKIVSVRIQNYCENNQQSAGSESAKLKNILRESCGSPILKVRNHILIAERNCDCRLCSCGATYLSKVADMQSLKDDLRQSEL
jgi:hypothetical protein